MKASAKFPHELASFLKAVQQRSHQEASPKGVPKAPGNEDSNAASDGGYAGEDLADPGLVNPVTGSGSGPVIG